MDFFNQLGKKASQTYKFTADKTSKLAKEAKTKMAMNENKTKVEELYQEIGRKVYENYVREEKLDLNESLTRSCEEIDVISNEIEAQRKEILKLNNKKQCENCYCEIKLEDNFCPNCGARQDELLQEEVTQDKQPKMQVEEDEE